MAASKRDILPKKYEGGNRVVCTYGPTVLWALCVFDGLDNDYVVTTYRLYRRQI